MNGIHNVLYSFGILSCNIVTAQRLRNSLKALMKIAL